MQRPTNYNTKQGEAILAYLASVKERFITAAEVARHFQNSSVSISRTTVYRQLERLSQEGKVRKHLFDGSAVVSYQYMSPEECRRESYHLKCESCGGFFPLQCQQVHHVSEHIYQAHAFQVNDVKTIFYGKCKPCLGKNGGF